MTILDVIPSPSVSHGVVISEIIVERSHSSRLPSETSRILGVQTVGNSTFLRQNHHDEYKFDSDISFGVGREQRIPEKQQHTIRSTNVSRAPVRYQWVHTPGGKIPICDWWCDKGGHVRVAASLTWHRSQKGFPLLKWQECYASRGQLDSFADFKKG